MTEKKIRVLIVDNHPIIRAGLVKLLGTEPDIDVVGALANNTDAVDKAAELKPDVITVDAFLPPRSGVDFILSMRDKLPEAKILVLTVSEKDEDLFQAVRSGVQAYLLKSASTGEVVEGIRRTAAGEATLSPPLLPKLMKGLQEKDAGSSGLNDKDRQLLRLFGKGLSNSEIALRLKITRNAVRYRIRRALKMLYFRDGVATS